MDKKTKFLFGLTAGILTVDMVTTFVNINFTKLKEANTQIRLLHKINPFMIFLYVPLVIGVLLLLYLMFKEYKLLKEFRSVLILYIFYDIMITISNLHTIAYFYMGGLN